MARHCIALVVLLALFARPSACRLPNVFRHGLHGGNDACSTCKFAVHALSDLLCDPYVDDTMVQWLDTYVCPQMPDKAQCKDIIRGVTPALVEWLRANADPEAMCDGMHVCGSAPSLFRDPFKQAVAKPRRTSRPNDMTCPLCMFVAGQIKQQINDPATQEDIRSASLAACAQLPASILDACTSFVEQYEMMYLKYVADLEPEEVCMMIGTCMDRALIRLQAQRNAPLLQLTPALLAPLGQVKAALDAASAVPGNDHCETCKVVVQELHQVVANPDLQLQIVDYAKQACAVFPSYEATCKADVDQYAPMAFGMILAYLQPEQVCVQLKMCPPPSLMTYLSVQTSLLGSKFAAFSVISTASSSSSSSSSSGADEGVEEALPGDSDSDAARPLAGQRVVVRQGKTHGPGLALPMAS